MIITGICKGCGVFVEFETSLPNSALKKYFLGRVYFFCSVCTKEKKWAPVTPGGLGMIQ